MTRHARLITSARDLTMRAGLVAVILALATAEIAGAAASSIGQAPWPTDEWPRSTAEEQGLDPLPLAELVELMREGERLPGLHSLLVVRNGYLVVEEYFAGYGPERLHTLQSVSKSFTSALIGIAIERGYIEGVDERILDFFPERRDELAADERRAAITLEALLTMRSGTDYHEGYRDSPHWQLNRLATGWDTFYLKRPMVREPGTHFQYDSGGVILMSSMLKQRSGMHADAFADRFLFPPLGINRTHWDRNREGHPHTGGGLDLTPRDMAKFGLLYLRGGRWEEKQVVPASWVAESFQEYVDFEGRRGGNVSGYGYLWWILKPDPAGAGEQPIYAAMGFRAQYIFLVPEHDIVVVVTGGAQSSADQRRPIEFLYSHILPAVQALSG